jgi:hypothetical protein
MLYAAPYTSEAILKINPFTDTWTEIPSGLAGTSIKYGEPILAPNGFIYFIPMGASQVMKLNPADDSITFFGSVGSAIYKWQSGDITENGIIYCMPLKENRILAIDTNNDTVSYVSTSLSNTIENYSKTIYARNGFFYGIPSAESRFIKFNPSNNDITLFGDISSDLLGFACGAVQMRNGQIFVPPYYHGTRATKLLTEYSIDKQIVLSRVKQ